MSASTDLSFCFVTSLSRSRAISGTCPIPLCVLAPAFPTFCAHTPFLYRAPFDRRAPSLPRRSLRVSIHARWLGLLGSRAAPLASASISSVVSSALCRAQLVSMSGTQRQQRGDGRAESWHYQNLRRRPDAMTLKIMRSSEPSIGNNGGTSLVLCPLWNSHTSQHPLCRLHCQGPSPSLKSAKLAKRA